MRKLWNKLSQGVLPVTIAISDTCNTQIFTAIKATSYCYVLKHCQRWIDVKVVLFHYILLKGLVYILNVFSDSFFNKFFTYHKKRGDIILTCNLNNAKNIIKKKICSINIFLWFNVLIYSSVTKNVLRALVVSSIFQKTPASSPPKYFIVF